MTGDVALRCPACGAPVLVDDNFCEACGTAVLAPAKRVAARRVEVDLAVAAAVSEQGRSHSRNEDAFHIERVGAEGVVVVVCDGISSSSSGDAAARAAAAAAAAVLVAAVGNGGDLAAATGAAVLAARAAVQHVPATRRAALALPSCTLVSAAWRDGMLVVGWVGDSRAYWLGADEARQLTVDDSWAAEQVAEGRLSAEEAFADRRAHAITRWVGADSVDAPQVTTLAPSQAGRLVLCTDGLWNTAPAPGELVALVAGLDANATPASVAHHLADAAMAAGSRDDVTVAVIDIEGGEGAQP
ncbi:MAG TPA: PP2C family serine/threonine-protein phosphatase [Solirubrobacteraceae bacterium]|jgi:serine/threonine protein phosphatase PrpC